MNSATCCSRSCSRRSSAVERGEYDFDAVARGIAEKLTRRHPHVFAPAMRAKPAHWEAIKAAEAWRAACTGVLDDVPLSLPALMRATKLGKRAATVGFDWPDADGARAKILEELAEVEAARAGVMPRGGRGSRATCCWPSPASRGTCTWIRKPHCGGRTGEFRGSASADGIAGAASSGGDSRGALRNSWMRCGGRRRSVFRPDSLHGAACLQRPGSRADRRMIMNKHLVSGAHGIHGPR